jgi:hypothetical protein
MAYAMYLMLQSEVQLHCATPEAQKQQGDGQAKTNNEVTMCMATALYVQQNSKTKKK